MVTFFSNVISYFVITFTGISCHKAAPKGYFLIELLFILVLLIPFIKYTFFLGPYSLDKTYVQKTLLTGYHTLSLSRLLSLDQDRSTIISISDNHWDIDNYDLTFDIFVKQLNSTITNSYSLLGFTSLGRSKYPGTIVLSRGSCRSKLSLGVAYGKVTMQL